MKIAYIAHPIGGDAKGNTVKVLAIIRDINLNEPGTVPFCPWLADVMAMDDGNPEQRARGLLNAEWAMFSTEIDELRLYGDLISPGMMEEVGWAYDFDIKVRPMTDGTREYFKLQ